MLKIREEQSSQPLERVLTFTNDQTKEVILSLQILCSDWRGDPVPINPQTAAVILDWEVQGQDASIHGLSWGFCSWLSIAFLLAIAHMVEKALVPLLIRTLIVVDVFYPHDIVWTLMRWPWTSDPPTATSQMMGLQVCATVPGWCGANNWIQSLRHAR